MTSWIIVIVLYVLGMGLFHILGGLGACAEAIRGWGEAASSIRNRTSPSS
jgi:hypothetical protein